MTPARKRADAGVPTPTGAGLWIRVAANLTDRKVTWRLVELIRAEHPAAHNLGGELPLDVLRAMAAGYLTQLWGKIAEHTADGVIVDLPPAQLEHWAGWGGTPGAFARWLFDWHFDADAGTCREWAEYAGALQAKRTSDAARQREKRDRDRRAQELAEAARRAGAELRADRVDASEPASGADAVRDVPDKPFVPTSADADWLSVLALQLTIAANKGMEANANLGGVYNPIAAGRGDALEVVATLVNEGVSDWDTMARIVFTQAKYYKPEKPGDYIRSLVFFRYSAVTAWKRHVETERAKNAAAITELAAAAPGAESPKGPGHPPRYTGAIGKARNAAAGALAAAKELGLPSALELEEQTEQGEQGDVDEPQAAGTAGTGAL